MPSSFNVDLWRSRARQRHVDRLTKKHDNHLSSILLKNDLTAIDGIKEVIDWCNIKGIKVILNAKELGGTFEQSTREMILNTRLLPQKMLHLMLHEAGHMLIGDSKPNARFGRGYNAKKTSDKAKNFSHRVDVIDEELCAWAEGEKLAKKLKITLNRDEYISTRDKNVKGYLEWVVRAGKFRHLKDEDDTDTYADDT